MLSQANTSAVIHCSAKAVLSIQMALPQHLQDVAICHSLMLRHTGHPQRYSSQYQQNARLLSSDSQGETLQLFFIPLLPMPCSPPCLLAAHQPAMCSNLLPDGHWLLETSPGESR